MRKELTTKNERRVSFETHYKRNRRPNNFPNQNTPNPINRFWDNQNRTTNNSNPSQNNYGIRHNYNYNGKNFQKASAQSSFNAKRPQTYDDRYPRENKFREKEHVAKQFYDQENRQFYSNPRVDKITLEAIITIIIETQRDLNHQILDRIKYSLKLPTGLKKK